MNHINVYSRKFWQEYLITTQENAKAALGCPLEPVSGFQASARESASANPGLAPIHNHYYGYDHHFPWFYTRREVIVVREPSRSAEASQSSEGDEEHVRNERAKWIGSAVLVVASALTGYVLSKLQATYQTWKMTNQIANKTVDWSVVAEDQDLAQLKNSLRDYVFAQQTIDRREVVKLAEYTIASLGFVFGGAAMAAGGFLAAPAMITLGKVTLLVSAAFGASSLGSHWGLGGNINKERNAMIRWADHLLTGLHESPDNLWQPSPPAYVEEGSSDSEVDETTSSKGEVGSDPYQNASAPPENAAETKTAES